MTSTLPPNTTLKKAAKASKASKTPQYVAYRENGEVKYMLADEANDFTASGGQMNNKPPSAWSSLPDSFLASAPNLLKEKFTDDSIIPVVVTNVKPTYDLPPRRRSFVDKLFKSDKEALRATKACWMPRRDYKKWFARDNQGNYVGSEPEREWTENELDEAFRKYAKVT